MAKIEAMEEATTLDVSFEEPEIVPEAEVGQPEPEPGVEMEEPEVEPPVKRRAPRKPRVPVEEEEPVKRKRAPRKKIPVESSDEEVELAPAPKRARAARQVEEPLTYLQLLQRGLLAAKATDKATKVARYDAYFARL